MLEVFSLHFEYPEHLVLQDIQFAVAPGTLCHIKGSNGSGKTTLLKVITGILPATTGDIRYGGVSVHVNLSLYQHQLAYVGHKTGVNALLTMRDHWHCDLRSYRHNFQDTVFLLGLEGLEDVPCGLLSVGQRRRVAFMRLMTSEASLWLLDEPFVGLDTDGMACLIELFHQHLEKNGLILLTSHQDFPHQDLDYQEVVL